MRGEHWLQYNLRSLAICSSQAIARCENAVHNHREEGNAIHKEGTGGAPLFFLFSHLYQFFFPHFLHLKRNCLFFPFLFFIQEKRNVSKSYKWNPSSLPEHKEQLHKSWPFYTTKRAFYKENIQSKQVLQVSSTKNLKYELHCYSHQPTSTSTLRYGEPSLRSSDRLLFNGQQRSSEDLKSHRTHHQRMSRRYQPYSTTLNNNTNAIQEGPLFGPIPSLVSASPSSSSSSSSLTSSPSLSFAAASSSAITSLNNASILEDDQVFDEFDDFIATPASNYLASPPPSPLLSPSNSSFNNDNNDEDDFDFSDFPLFSWMLPLFF